MLRVRTATDVPVTDEQDGTAGSAGDRLEGGSVTPGMPGPIRRMPDEPGDGADHGLEARSWIFAGPQEISAIRIPPPASRA